MTTAVIDRQAEAFRASVRDDEGTSLEESTAKAQHLIDFGIVIAKHYIAASEPLLASGALSRDAASERAATVRATMTAMVQIQDILRTTALPEGIALASVKEFAEAIVDLRELIADLQGVAAGHVPPPPPTETEAAAQREEFRRLAETHRPPQSWYEEDFTGVAGPGGP